jgi:transcriptional regulator with XRE-family HTH domain
MYVYNPFGTAPEDFDKETAGSRIGRRIRAIRQEQGISQSELAEKVNEIAENYAENSTALNANRIQQYENGARNPKFDLCKQIAEALEVETSAILDPQTASYLGAMFSFFEMETLYDLRLQEVNGQICISFGESQNDIKVSTMNKNLKAWYDRRKQMEVDIFNASTEEEKKQIMHEYHMWEWNFPYSMDEKPLSKSERAKKERVAHLLQESLEARKNDND